MREFARLLSVLLSIYNMLIIIRIILQWFNPMRLQGSENSLTGILAKIVDPYLNLFKGIGALRRGRLDFTPLVALIIINIVQRILQTFAYTGQFSLGYTLATIVQSLWWSIGSLILGIFAVLLGVRLFFAYRRTPNSIQYISMLDSWLMKPLDTIHSWFFRGREVSDRMLLWTAITVTIITYVGIAILVNLLVQWLVNLPF
ncbi:YggT family protein [Pleomorphochaeta sp. DL1XJH-081]|jgi:YggT family protein|uniref:YggT family protein n=1 Tax=Pleomorphochaeta sp. DL1XJH-081 TaxID=3409690 RepID=UPI003BB70131